MNKLYRIISQYELNQIKEIGKIKTTPRKWEPYSENQIVLLFEGDNVNTIFNKFGSTVAELRNLNKCDSIYLLEISKPPGDVENDKSASKWPESRAHFGDIPNSCVLIIGESKVIISKPGKCKIDELIVFEKPKLFSGM